MRLIVLLALLISGCRDVPLLPSVTPHRIDIQQGNVVTQDMVDKLQPGMSRSQVRFILGTPLVADPFHPDRWDYVFLYAKAGQVTEKRRLIVHFKDDRFVRVEGDPMPAAPAARGAAPEAKPAPPPPGKAADPGSPAPEPAREAAAGEPAKKESQGEEKGFFGRMLERLGF